MSLLWMLAVLMLPHFHHWAESKLRFHSVTMSVSAGVYMMGLEMSTSSADDLFSPPWPTLGAHTLQMAHNPTDRIHGGDYCLDINTACQAGHVAIVLNVEIKGPSRRFTVVLSRQPYQSLVPVAALFCGGRVKSLCAHWPVVGKY